MVNSARKNFNESFSGEKYDKMIQEIHKEFIGILDFRIAESPIFVNNQFKIKLLTAFNDIVDQIKHKDFKLRTDAAIPEDLFLEGESAHPDCMCIDFAVCKNDAGELEPQLIELQGFPSLFAYQSYLAGKYRKHFSVERNYSEFFNRLNGMNYNKEMAQFLLGNSKPENTILLEIFPEKQKTRIDFKLTEMLWSIKAVCVTEIYNEGDDLYYNSNGSKIKIERIYNRFIVDDLKRNYPELKLKVNFNLAKNVSWISHPNWFYRLSKFTLPLFRSKYIPQSWYLSNLNELPQDLENYVLKPLYSYAGTGVIVDLNLDDIKNIQDPENYILQRKVYYEPCIVDINGEGIKAEIRLLAIWPKNADRPKLMTNLVRLSRGKMIGVDYNKDFDWVGGSIGYFETN